MARALGQCVVLGASIGGIVAARVVADHAERVLVVERDATTPRDASRKGVPHGCHAHGLLARGREALEELFPGWSAEMAARGAVFGNPGSGGRWIHGGHTMARVPSRSDGILASRPLVESTLVEQLARLPNVVLRRETDAVEVVADAERARVQGVRLRDRASGRDEVVSADLVVDALGRGSPTPKWLEALGYAPPEVEDVKVDVHYTTRIFARRTEDFGGDHFVIVGAVPPCRGVGVALAQEGDRFIVTLAGYLGDRAPTDLGGFRAYARALPAPDIGDYVETAEPVGDAMTASFPASRRRRYEKVARFPDGLLVFGDAFASFNPIYGQGMSVVALEALALGRCLASGTDGLAGRFFREVARIVDVPWGSVVLNDLRFPEVVAKRPPLASTLHAYIDRVYERAAHDEELALAVLDVVNLVREPSSLMAPRNLGRVLFPRPSAPRAAASGGRSENAGEAPR